MKRFTILAITLSATFAAADVSVIDNDQTIAVDCAKDKNVNLVGNGAKITMTGTCDSVNISGDDAAITGSVKKVAISGDKNKLTLDAVDHIMISGNDNSVSYKKTVTASKKKAGVLDSGDRNKVGKAK